MALSPKGIAQRLKTLRQEQGLTMRALAKNAKTSVGYLAISRPGRSRTNRWSSSSA
jgi:transcriptional regulator with XRE-family HTH domain